MLVDRVCLPVMRYIVLRLKVPSLLYLSTDDTGSLGREVGAYKIQDTRLYLTNFGPSKGIQRCCTENKRGNPNQR